MISMTNAMWLANPAYKAAGETGDEADYQAASQAEDGNPQRLFRRLPAKLNGRLDGTPVKLHSSFLLPCRKTEACL